MRALIWALVGMAVLANGLGAQEKAPKRITSQARKAENNPRPDKRIEAIERLRDEEHPLAVESLARCLSDNDKSVRGAAARALWMSESPSLALAVPALRAALKDPSPDVAVLVANALARLGAPPDQLVDSYREGLMANLPVSRFYAARGLIGTNPATQLMPTLLEYLDYRASRTNDTQEATEAVVRLVEETQDRGLVYDLMGVVRSNPTIAPHALLALSRYDPPEEGFEELLQEQLANPQVALKFLEVLEQHPSKASFAADDLQRLSTSENDEIRKIAESILLELSKGN